MLNGDLFGSSFPGWAPGLHPQKLRSGSQTIPKQPPNLNQQQTKTELLGALKAFERTWSSKFMVAVDLRHQDHQAS